MGVSNTGLLGRNPETSGRSHKRPPAGDSLYSPGRTYCHPDHRRNPGTVGTLSRFFAKGWAFQILDRLGFWLSLAGKAAAPLEHATEVRILRRPQSVTPPREAFCFFFSAFTT
jgi:hypothetical protein